MNSETEKKIVKWIEQWLEENDLRDYYTKDEFRWDDGSLAFATYKPIDDDGLPEINIGMPTEAYNRYDLTVWIKATRKWIDEVTDYNKEALKKIAEVWEEIKEMWLDKTIPLDHYDEFLVKLTVSSAEPFYDEVGSKWNTSAVWLGLTYSFARMPNQKELNEALDFLTNPITEKLVWAKLVQKDVKTLLNVIDSLVDDTYKGVI